MGLNAPRDHLQLQLKDDLTSRYDDHRRQTDMSNQLSNYEEIFDRFQIDEELDLTFSFVGPQAEYQNDIDGCNYSMSSSNNEETYHWSHSTPDNTAEFYGSEANLYAHSCATVSSEGLTTTTATTGDPDYLSGTGTHQQYRIRELSMSGETVFGSERSELWYQSLRKDTKPKVSVEVASVLEQDEAELPVKRLSHEPWFYANLPGKIKRSFLNPDEQLVAQRDSEAQKWCLRCHS
ncbi:hypothetical protein QQS21_000275 [Conoideocrella luteorostrata]|uniref:Uncharacterized protein n=1 Tax=Conoideocrella luteorostrata TaxID=1105319 RepID=A0AAJ0G2Q8_9HYPO|nr:hypothetical protein QQS21_000275 [Conoideocrella luteorostrata]